MTTDVEHFSSQQCLDTIAIHFGPIEPTGDLEEDAKRDYNLARLIHVMKQYHMAIDHIADKYRNNRFGKMANDYLDWLGIPE